MILRLSWGIFILQRRKYVTLSGKIQNNKNPPLKVFEQFKKKYGNFVDS